MKIRYFALLREITRVNEEQWLQPVASVEELLNALCKKYGKEFRRWVSDQDGGHGKLSIILVNGIDMRSLQGPQTLLKPEDDIFIFPPVAGG